MIRKIESKYKALPIAAKAAFWYMIGSFLQKGILALTTPIFARLMSTEQYGQFTVYMSWTNILMIVATLKLDDSVFNVGMSKFKDHRDAYVSTMQIVTIVISSIMMLIFVAFHTSISSFVGLPCIIVGLMIVETYANSASFMWNKRKQYEYQYKQVLLKYVSMTLLNTVLGLVLVITTSNKGYARIISCVSVNLMFGVVILIYNLVQGRGAFVFQYAKFGLLFNLPLLGHYLSLYILDQFDRIMIQKMVGFSAAGLYGIAYHIGTILTLLTTSLSNALTPWLYGKLEKQDYSIIGRIVLYIVFMVSIMAVCVSALAPEIIELFGGNQYREAIIVIPPIALSMVFKLVYVIFASIEFFYEKNKAAMFMSGFAAALDIVLNYIGITFFGYAAAAYTTLICYVVMYGMHYIYAIKCIAPYTNERQTIRVMLINCVLIVTSITSVCFTFTYQYIAIRVIIVLLIVFLLVLFRSTIKETLNMIRTK